HRLRLWPCGPPPPSRQPGALFQLAQPWPSLPPRLRLSPCPRRAHPAAPPSASTAPTPARPSGRVRSSPRATEPSRSPPPCATGPALSIALRRSPEMATVSSPAAHLPTCAVPPLADVSPPRPRLNGVCLPLLVGDVPARLADPLPQPSFDVLPRLHAV